jgi:hypothetical protein
LTKIVKNIDHNIGPPDLICDESGSRCSDLETVHGAAGGLEAVPSVFQVNKYDSANTLFVSLFNIYFTQTFLPLFASSFLSITHNNIAK